MGRTEPKAYVLGNILGHIGAEFVWRNFTAMKPETPAKQLDRFMAKYTPEIVRLARAILAKMRAHCSTTRSSSLTTATRRWRGQMRW